MIRMIDLFCGAGGCSSGYHKAGIHSITGVDIKPQPRYPFHFIQGDALEYLRQHGHEYDVIHASPPCQHYSVATKSRPGQSEKHPDLVGPTRDLLIGTGKPWVIENVVGAPLIKPMMLCGSHFDLLVQRHRLFESNVPLRSPGRCRHEKFVGNYRCGRSNQSKRAGERSKVVHVYGEGGSRGDCDLWRKAMGIEWMSMKELAQAIPPAYTEWIGKQIVEHLHDRKVVRLANRTELG